MPISLYTMQKKEMRKKSSISEYIVLEKVGSVGHHMTTK